MNIVSSLSIEISQYIIFITTFYNFQIFKITKSNQPILTNVNYVLSIS